MSCRPASNLNWLRSLPAVSEDEPLGSRTSFGIGGPADFFIEMSRPVAIEEVISGAAQRGIPYLLLGAGTNLLIADAGVEGLVVRVVNREHHVDGRTVRAGAGLKMMRLARIVGGARRRGGGVVIRASGTGGGGGAQKT